MTRCPVCDYDWQREVELWLICPQCGVEYGHDDYVDDPNDLSLKWEELREAWVARGRPIFDPEAMRREIGA